jgi:hypothetical protein
VRAERAEHLDALLATWAREWTSGGLTGEIEHRDEPDARGDYHWLVRVPSEEKGVITIWWRLAQRRVHVECELLPTPEESHESLYRYLLTRNARLGVVHCAIGPEEGIYLVGAMDLAEVSVARVDEVVAACVTYVDEMYPTAMSIAHPRWYRRAPRRAK